LMMGIPPSETKLIYAMLASLSSVGDSMNILRGFISLLAGKRVGSFSDNMISQLLRNRDCFWQFQHEQRLLLEHSLDSIKRVSRIRLRGIKKMKQVTLAH